jgi:hypothetical protein
LLPLIEKEGYIRYELCVYSHIIVRIHINRHMKCSTSKEKASKVRNLTYSSSFLMSIFPYHGHCSIALYSFFIYPLSTIWSRNWKRVFPPQNTQNCSGAGTTSNQRVPVFSPLSGKRTERDINRTFVLEPKIREIMFVYFCPYKPS